MPPRVRKTDLIYPAGPALEQVSTICARQPAATVHRSPRGSRPPHRLAPQHQVVSPTLPFRSDPARRRRRSGPAGNGTSNSVRHRSKPSSVRSSNLLSLSTFSRWRTLRLTRSDRVSMYTSCSSTTLTAGSRDEGGSQAASRVGRSWAIHRNSQAWVPSIIGASSPALPRSLRDGRHHRPVGAGNVHRRTPATTKRQAGVPAGRSPP